MATKRAASILRLRERSFPPRARLHWRYVGPMIYEYTVKLIPLKKKGWHELGEAVVELPAEGWELFLAVPIIEPTLFWLGRSGSRTTAIVHYFRRAQP